MNKKIMSLLISFILLSTIFSGIIGASLSGNDYDGDVRVTRIEDEGIISFDPVTASELDQIVSDEGLICTLFDDGTVRIDEFPVNYGGVGATVLNIPGTVNYSNNTYDVTVIGADAKVKTSSGSRSTTIETLNIPSSVVKIEDTFTNRNFILYHSDGMSKLGGVFSYSKLKDINIASDSQLKYIGDGAFFEVGKSVTVSSFTLPDSVEYVGNKVFTNIPQVVISSSSNLKGVGVMAFYGLASTVSITLPDSMEYIGGGAPFGKATITYPSQFIVEDGVVYTADGKTVLSFSGASTNITIRSGAEIIADWAFQATSIKNVVLPDSVVTIGKYAFANCANLESVVFTEHSSLKSIKDYAFAIGWFFAQGSALNTFGWESSGTVIFPASTETIGDCAFSPLNLYGEPTNNSTTKINENISRIKFVDDNNLKSIGKYAFFSIDIDTITFGSSSSSVTGVIIDDGAFSRRGGGTNASSLNQIERVIFDPETFKLESIGYLAFGMHLYINSSSVLNAELRQFGCTDGVITIPATVKTIGPSAFSYDGTISNEQTNVFLIPNITKVEFEIGSQIESIGYRAFARLGGCNAIDLSNCSELKAIGSEAFSLKTAHGIDMSGSITFPASGNSSLETIEDEAFFGRTLSLTATDNKITIPSSVQSIGDRAFALSASGSSVSYTKTSFEFDNYIISLGTAPFGYNSDGTVYSKGIYFGNGTSTTAINVPANTVLLNADVLRSPNIQSISTAPRNHFFSTSADGRYLYLDTDELVLIKAVKTLTLAEVSEDIDVVRSYAFYGCNTLEAMFIYGTAEIEDYAFINCSSLKAVLVNSSSIGEYAFYGCRNLTLFEPLGSAIGESALSQYGNYGGETYSGLDGGIILISEIPNQSIMISDGSYSEGTFSFKMFISGWYSHYDVHITTLNGTVVSYNDGIYSVNITSANLPELIYVSAKERTGDTWEVTVNSTDGAFEDGSDIKTILIPKGMSILEKDIERPVKNKAVMDGWYLDADLTIPFDIVDNPVNGNISLYPKWVAADPLVTFYTPYGTIKATVSGNVFMSGERTHDEITFEYMPGTGYDFVSWTVTEYGSASSSYNEYILKYNPGNDTRIEVNVRYSSGANLNLIVSADMPTSGVPRVFMSWTVGGAVDTSMVAWSGHASIPIIVEDHVYARIGDRLYKIEADTGYVVTSVQSRSTTSFYHYVGSGEGLILDYLTGSVYNLNLNFVYSMPSDVISATYFEGHFYGPTNTGDIIRFDAATGQVDNTWKLSGINWFGLYGQKSAPLFIDGYMYFISHPGGDLRQLASVSLTNSNDAHTITLDGINKQLLDKGWLTYYDGKLYMTTYVEGLFGNRVANGSDTIVSVPINNGVFGTPTYTVIKLNINGEDTYFYGPSSAFVILDGKGYVNASGGGATSSKSTCLIVYDVKTMEPLYYYLSEMSHGGIVVNTYFEDEGDTYVYLIPYASNRNLLIFSDNGSSINVVGTSYNLGTYNSQAVRTDEDGRMVWYNDSGWVRGVTVAEKNPYYFFIEDNDEAKWVVGYGESASEALANLGYSSIPGNAYALVSLVYGGNSSYKPGDYEWVLTPQSNMGDSLSVLSHYWIITTNASGPDSILGSSWDYYGGTYVFKENIGDRSLIGVEMVRPGAVVHARGVTIETSSMDMGIGENATLTYNVYPSYSVNKNVLWSSNDNTVMSVDQSGNVSALKEGTATITVTTVDGGHEASCIVTVSVAPPVRVIDIVVTGAGGVSSITVNGGTLQMSASILPNEATNKSVIWSIANGTAATVNSSGLLTAMSNGNVTVRATATDGSRAYGELDVTINGQIVMYSVSYNANGGTGSVTMQNAASGTQVTLSSSSGMTAPAGKQFKEWNTTSSGFNGTVYQTGQTVTLNGNLMLYAIWEDTPASPDDGNGNADNDNNNKVELNTEVIAAIAAAVIGGIVAAGYFIFIRKP